MSDDLAWLDATAQSELVRSGQASARELVDAAIERIEKVDPQLNAVIHRRFERAVDEARGPLPDGPFTGVPFLVKDLYLGGQGDPMHNGNAALRSAGHRADHDAWLVARYRAAGFVIAGRTNTPEFGLTPTTEPVAHGATHNPWNLNHSPGGSSGGAAAAVAAGLVPVAHASDGGGSIRIPASMCGLVGLKVSRGRTTLGPDGDESQLSVSHVVSRSVRDSAAVLDATHGPGPGDMAVAPPPSRPFAAEIGADPGSLRIGVVAHSPRGELHPDCVTAVDAAAALLESLGHRVEQSYPVALDGDQLSRAFAVRWCTNARRAVAATSVLLVAELGAEDFEASTWMMAEAGRSFSAIDFADAIAASAAFSRSVASWWADGWDLLLTPTLAGPPPRLGELTDPKHGSSRISALVPFTPAFNVTGQPAVSLPLHWNDAELPVGVQLVGAYGREDLLIRVASQLESAAPWAHRRPPTSA